MSEPVDITIETKSLAISSRRRLQNRMAQRRFRGESSPPCTRRGRPQKLTAGTTPSERRASKKRLEAKTTPEWSLALPYMTDDSFSDSATLGGPSGLGSMYSLLSDLCDQLPYYDMNSSGEDDGWTRPAKRDAPRGPPETNPKPPSERPHPAGVEDGFGTTSILGQVHPHLFDLAMDAQLGYPLSGTDAGPGREEMLPSSAWSADGTILASPISLPPLLHVAVRSRNRKVVTTLLKHGAAGVDERDPQGCTALHVAVALGDKDLVVMLLQHGANIHSQDAHGRSALYLAVSEGHNEILELLLRYASITSR